MLAGCGARVAYSPLPGVSVSAPIPVPASAGGHARLPSGKGGAYKTGRPYRVGGRTYYPLASARGYDEVGIASWYGRDFHGRRTANGEIFDMRALSAAHRTLPLPTMVRVTNLENGRSVIVRVNDRGPFVKNRLIDLSWAAARELGFVHKGTARVRVQSLDVAPRAHHPVLARRAPVTPAARQPATRTPARASVRPATLHARSDAGMYVQLGAFAEADNASRLKRKLASSYPSVRVEPFPRDGRMLYRVRIGPFQDVQRIEQTVLSLQQRGYGNAVVVIE